MRFRSSYRCYIVAATLTVVAACNEPEQAPPPAPEIVRAPTQAISQMALQDMAACADDHAPLLNDLGNFSRSINTGLEVAQAYFDQGMKLTYGYHFPEAIASFDAALCFEPGNAMIHWGRALAIGPSHISRYAEASDDPTGAGRSAISRAVALRDTVNVRERGLIDALAALYNTDARSDQATRTQAFVEAAQNNYQTHDQDPEAAYLVAYAIMMTVPRHYYTMQDSDTMQDGGPQAAIVRARNAVEQGLTYNARHPGLRHLHIQLQEESLAPDNALVAADQLEPLVAEETLQQAWGNRRLPEVATWSRR